MPKTNIKWYLVSGVCLSEMAQALSKEISSRPPHLRVEIVKTLLEEISNELNLRRDARESLRENPGAL